MPAMRTRLVIGSLIAMGATSSVPLSAHAKEQTFSVDAVHSTVIFGIQHLGAGRFYGRFNDVSGTISHDADVDTGLNLDIVVAIDSVDTGNDGLDQHLKGGDFFSADQYATMTFKSTAVKRKDAKVYEVTGDLTLHGVTKQQTIDMEWHGTADKGRGLKCGFETAFVIERSDFGMSWGVDNGALGNDVRIIVSLEANAASERKESDSGDKDAAGGGGRGQRMLARFDANKDGKLQKEEAPERMQSQFDELDKNGDGVLDADEVGAMSGRRRGG